MANTIAIALQIAVINHLVLHHALGVSTLLNSTRSMRAAWWFGAFTTAVVTLSTMGVWLIEHELLPPLNLEALRLPIIALWIASLVVIAERWWQQHTVVKEWLASSSFILLILGNSLVFSASLLSTQLSWWASSLTALIAGLVFMVTLAIFTALRARIEGNRSPRSLRGLPLDLLALSLFSLAWLGIQGL